jgi:hypothetical protein
MVSARHCRDHTAECVRLTKSATTKDQAEVLRNISASWSRLAGQIERYDDLVRKQRVPQREVLNVRATHGLAARTDHETSP